MSDVDEQAPDGPGAETPPVEQDKPRRRSHRSKAERIAKGELRADGSDPAIVPPADALEDEAPPAPRKRGLFRAGEKKPRPPTRGRHTRKRESTAAIGTFLYRQVGAFLETTAYYPSGRIMVWQAEAAGVVLDELVAGTALDDRALQPLMAQEKRAEALGALVGPPLLAGLASRSPEAFTQLEPMVRFMLRQSLAVILPAAARAKKAEAAQLAAIADAMGGSIPDGMTIDDFLDGMIADLFAPPMAPQHAAPEDRVTEEV